MTTSGQGDLSLTCSIEHHDFPVPQIYIVVRCAIRPFSDFALLHFNMIVLHTAACSLKLYIISKKSPLNHMPPSWAREIILLPLLTSTVLHKPIHVGNVSAIKVSFLIPPIRHNQINSTRSTYLCGAIRWLSLWFWEQCWTYCITTCCYYHAAIRAGAMNMKDKRAHLHKYLNCTIFACKFYSYVCFDNKTVTSTASNSTFQKRSIYL